MAWTYKILTGALTDSNGQQIATGYAGKGTAKNDPSRIKEKGIGPLPPGAYHIGPAYTHAHLGPMTMNLDPTPITQMWGRALMRIHGDSIKDPGNGSNGCIVLPLKARRLIAASTDRMLEVVA
jgi:hypothetical protein